MRWYKVGIHTHIRPQYTLLALHVSRVVIGKLNTHIHLTAIRLNKVGKSGLVSTHIVSEHPARSWTSTHINELEQGGARKSGWCHASYLSWCHWGPVGRWTSIPTHRKMRWVSQYPFLLGWVYWQGPPQNLNIHTQLALKLQLNRGT